MKGRGQRKRDENGVNERGEMGIEKGGKDKKESLQIQTMEN